MRNATETRGIKGKRHTVGIGYIIIPGDVKRSNYISNCLRNGKVAVQFENGSFMMEVPVMKNVLPFIEFPSEVGELGSCVVCVNEYVHNQPIISGILMKEDEVSTLHEHEFRLEKYSDNGSVFISGRADKGDLFVNVIAKQETGGRIFVNVSNPENSGGVYVNVNGDINVELQSYIMKALKTLVMTSKDDMSIDSDTKIVLGVENNVQANLKGDDTVVQLKKEVQALTSLLNSIINIVPSSVTPGVPDPTWLAWQTVVSGITDRGNYDEVQSEKTFIE
jgi:hypothetical protein